MNQARLLVEIESATAEPWWLHEGSTVRWIEDGAVDIFLAGIRDGRPVGPRRFLYRASAATAVMPIPRTLTRPDEALLAVPLPQTRISAAPLEQLKRLAALPERRAEVIGLLASWLGVITRGLPVPPKDYRPLRHGTPLSVEQGAAFCSVERLSWTRVSGPCAFMGETELQVDRDTPALPLRSDVWLRATAQVTVETVDEGTLFDSGEIWSGIAAYQEHAIRQAITWEERASRDDAARLHVKAEQAARVVSDALVRFVKVVRGEDEPAPELSPDPLLAACQIIGRRIKVEFRAPPKRATQPVGVDRLQEIVECSAVSTREVALKGEWWRGDNGPLIVHDAETKAPYALLPVKDTRYELHDPATGAVKPVTREIAGTLAPFATQFYRPFPAKAIRVVDMLRFGIAGLHREIALVVALGTLGGLVGMAIPIATGKMVDSIIPSAQHNDAIALMIALIAALAASEIFEFVRSVAVLRLEGKMDNCVQSAVWDRVLSLPVPFFRNYTAGDLENRINGINVIRHTLSGTTVATLLSSAFSLLNLFVLFYYSATLAGLALGLTVVAMLVTGATGYLKLRYERQLADIGGRISGLVFQYLLGISKLRVAAAENRAFANWAREFTGLRRIAFKAQSIAVVDHTFFSVYGVLINATVFAVVGMVLVKESGAKLSTGEFVAFTAAFGMFFGGFVGLTETALGLLNLVPVYERAKPILHALPEVSAEKKHPGELVGSIEVVKVAFAYGAGPEILRDVTFTVRPGGFVALVGPSGSGKSTLFRLLLGFEKPTRGSIYYDNQDLADLDIRAVRRQLGVVLQGGQLMTGDIYTNIVGAGVLSIDDAWEAAAMVGLDEDIKKMPMGMHTVISEGSSTLSGGQRQRILIARAIVHRPRILFFDEATSALDNRTQAIVSRSLEQLKATRIVIAHRLSTVINADRIIVLQDGAIAQTGTYQELIEQTGPFAELAKRQIA